VTLAVLLLAITIAAVVQVVSGFGFALVAAPVIVAVTDPVTSVSIIAVLGALVSAFVLTTGSERPQPLRRTTVALLAWSAPGVVAGAVIVSRLPEDAVRAAVGVLVLAALAQRTLAPRRSARAGGARGDRAHGTALAGAGLVSGALTTSTGLNGPPLVLYLTARDTPPRRARDTLAVIFFVLGVAAIGTLAAFGNLELPTETFALPFAALAGVLVGHRIFDRLTPQALGRVVTATLIAAALTALGAALL
jgi:uncharacterized membrane protein YfcA